MVRLLRNSDPIPFGLYQCSIPDKRNVNYSLFVGIYSSAEGTLYTDNYYAVRLVMSYFCCKI